VSASTGTTYYSATSAINQKPGYAPQNLSRTAAFAKYQYTTNTYNPSQIIKSGSTIYAGIAGTPTQAEWFIWTGSAFI
jgi:hypothetical protein